MPTPCCEKDTNGDGDCPVHASFCLPKGAVIQVEGIPVELVNPVKVKTHRNNAKLIMDAWTSRKLAAPLVLLGLLFLSSCTIDRPNTPAPELKAPERQYICFVNDSPVASRFDRITAPSGKPYVWNKTVFFYRFDPKLPEIMRASFVECARVWRAASGGTITFTEVGKDGHADIIILPMVMPEPTYLGGCSYSEVVDNVIGIAKIEINLFTYKWHKGAPFGITTTKLKRDVDIDGVMLHELGHALGLNHSADVNATMYRTVFPGAETIEADDVRGVRMIFGDGAK